MTFRFTHLTLITAALAFSGSMATPAYAGPSDAECAIYLCLPAGFPGGACSASLDAMIDRIKEGKSAIPKYSQCNFPSSNSTARQSGHQVSFAPCRSGYTPAQPDESLSDVTNRDPVPLSPFGITEAAQRTATFNDGVNTCVNTSSGSRYTPIAHHKISVTVISGELTNNISTDSWSHTVTLNAPKRGGGAGNVR